MSHSPLLEADIDALDDPTFTSPGLAARDAVEHAVDRVVHEQVYGSTENTTADVEAQSDGPPVLSQSQLISIISSLYIGGFLSALDTTVVTTLLSTIASDINAVSQMSWIATSYLLSCSAFQPLYGKLSDIFGRKPLLIFSNVMFALGCLISGYCHNLVGLSVGRFVTGIGGGGLTSLSVITVSDLVPLRKRGVYQGFGNIVFGLGASTGGMWGAFFQKYAGWEWAFYSQVPISLFSMVMIWKSMKLPPGSIGLGIQGSKKEKLKQVDFIGASLLVTMLLSFMALISFSGNELEIGSSVFWFLTILMISTGVLFVYVELNVAPQPVIPVKLLAYRTVLSSSLVNWFMSMAVFTYLFYVPVFWSSVLGLTPTEIGLRTIANFVGVSMGSYLSGLYMKHTGKYLKFSVIANFITIFGVWSLYRSGRDTPDWFQFIELYIPGAGYASSLTVTLLALIASVPLKDQAATTSIQYAFRATGSTIGVSVSSFIFQRSLVTQLQRLYLVPSDFSKKEITEIIAKAANSAEYTWSAPKVFRDLIRDSYDIGSHSALFFSVITVILAWSSGLFIQEHHLHTTVNRK
jgi:MFS family permease